METIQLKKTSPLAFPSCDMCGESTRLVGLEPHPVEYRTDVCTYQCNTCGAVQIREAQRERPTRLNGQ
jgi:hypothetical protein